MVWLKLNNFQEPASKAEHKDVKKRLHALNQQAGSKREHLYFGPKLIMFTFFDHSLKHLLHISRMKSLSIFPYIRNTKNEITFPMCVVKISYNSWI